MRDSSKICSAIPKFSSVAFTCSRDRYVLEAFGKSPSAPFVPAWYQGDLKTNAIGRGVLDVTGIFSAETFILNPGVPAVPVNLTHLGIWFADPADAVTAGCAATVTPFDGDHNAGIQVLHTVPAVGPLGPLARIK